MASPNSVQFSLRIEGRQKRCCFAPWLTGAAGFRRRRIVLFCVVALIRGTRGTPFIANSSDFTQLSVDKDCYCSQTRPQQIGSLIFSVAHFPARVRYSDMLHDIKELRGENDSGRPSFITKEMWKGLCAYWDTPKVIAWSEAARKCRLSEPDGSGTGYRSHRGGSKLVEILAQEMACRKGGIPLEKCVYPSFRAIHVNKDGTYRSKKAEKIDTKVKAIAAERGEGADLNEIYMEVNRDELRKKQRMYGTGSLASTLLRDNSTATHQVHHCDSRLEEVEKQLQAERERRLLLEERFRATQETVQLLLSRQDSRTLGDHNSPAPSR